MFFQMHMILMPMADNSQRIMFKLMPVIFLFECYFTIWADFVLDCTNLLTIIQQYAVSSKQGAQLMEFLPKMLKRMFGKVTVKRDPGRSVY